MPSDKPPIPPDTNIEFRDKEPDTYDLIKVDGRWGQVVAQSPHHTSVVWLDAESDEVVIINLTKYKFKSKRVPIDEQELEAVLSVSEIEKVRFPEGEGARVVVLFGEYQTLSVN